MRRGEEAPAAAVPSFFSQFNFASFRDRQKPTGTCSLCLSVGRIGIRWQRRRTEPNGGSPISTRLPLFLLNDMRQRTPRRGRRAWRRGVGTVVFEGHVALGCIFEGSLHDSPSCKYSTCVLVCFLLPGRAIQEGRRPNFFAAFAWIARCGQRGPEMDGLILCHSTFCRHAMQATGRLSFHLAANTHT